MSQMPPPPPGSSPGSSQAPAPSPYGTYQPARESRPVSFYLAIFLGLLLLVSGGLNLLMLVYTSASGFGGTATAEPDGALFEVVVVEDDPEAEGRLLRIPIEGAIAEGASPVIGAPGGTVSQVRRSLALAERDDRIKGVLLDINSPGGGVTDSDLIHGEITDFRERTGKPVLALFGDISASGGYYIAAACDGIMARRTTITGSIGVVMNTLNYGEAAKKIGIEQVTITSSRTPYKDIMSPTRPMTDEERAILTGIVDELYDRFVDVVDAGREDLSREQVLALANGSIYSASQALSNGLIDDIGTRGDALRELRRLAGVSKAMVVEHRRRPGFAELLFGVRSPNPSLSTSVAQLLRSTTGPKFLYYWTAAR